MKKGFEKAGERFFADVGLLERFSGESDAFFGPDFGRKLCESGKKVIAVAGRDDYYNAFGNKD